MASPGPLRHLKLPPSSILAQPPTPNLPRGRSNRCNCSQTRWFAIECVVVFFCLKTNLYLKKNPPTVCVPRFNGCARVSRRAVCTWWWSSYLCVGRRGLARVGFFRFNFFISSFFFNDEFFSKTDGQGKGAVVPSVTPCLCSTATLHVHRFGLALKILKGTVFFASLFINQTPRFHAGQNTLCSPTLKARRLRLVKQDDRTFTLAGVSKPSGLRLSFRWAMDCAGRWGCRRHRRLRPCKSLCGDTAQCAFRRFAIQAQPLFVC